MGNFLLNQNIKKSKTIKDFDSFDSLINWDGVGVGANLPLHIHPFA